MSTAFDRHTAPMPPEYAAARINSLESRVVELERLIAQATGWAPNRARTVTANRLATMRASSVRLWSAVQVAGECGIPTINATHQWIRGCVGRGQLERVATGRYRVAK